MIKTVEELNEVLPEGYLAEIGEGSGDDTHHQLTVMRGDALIIKYLYNANRFPNIWVDGDYLAIVQSIDRSCIRFYRLDMVGQGMLYSLIFTGYVFEVPVSMLEDVVATLRALELAITAYTPGLVDVEYASLAPGASAMFKHMAVSRGFIQKNRGARLHSDYYIRDPENGVSLYENTLYREGRWFGEGEYTTFDVRMDATRWSISNRIRTGTGKSISQCINVYRPELAPGQAAMVSLINESHMVELLANSTVVVA